MRTPLRIAGRSALAALLILATTTCTEQPTEPGGVHSGQVRFTPVFPANTFLAGLPIDNITVTVVRPAAETLVVRNAPFALTDSVLNLAVTVPLDAPSESLQVSVDLQSGASILFHGTDLILVSAGNGGTTPPPIALTYVGPGANIAFLSIAPFDTILTFGDTLFYSASAEDPQENPVASFYLHWYTTPTGTSISPAGRVIAPNVRSTIEVHARTPSGEEDSTALTFMPRPTQLLKISGDLQNDTISDTLAVPLVVEVRAADNLPVAGVAVTFAATTVGGSVLTTAMVTDSLGRASTTAVLGDTARSYSYTATVTGVAPATFTATASAGPAAAIAKVSGDAQSDTAGKTLPLPLVVRVADAGNNPVAGAVVIWTRRTGSGTPALDTVLTNGSGLAQLSYTLGGPGTDSIRALLAGTGAYVDFTATAAISAVKVVVISGDSQTDTVGRVLPESLVVETEAVGSSIPVAGIQVIWAINVGTGVLSADTTVTDSLGRSAVVLAFDTVSGPVEVLVDAHQGGALGVFHFTAVSGPPHHLAFVVQPKDSIPVGVVMVPAPTIQVRDTFNNPVKVAGTKLFLNTNSSVGAPKPPKFAPGKVIQFSGYPGGRDSALTDTNGTAVFDSATVVGGVGPETLRFSANGTVAPDLIWPFIMTPGAPNSVIAVAGNGQSAFVDSLVATAPQALVVDTGGNGVPGVQVDFVVTAGGGSVTGGTVVTDSLGYATVGSWRMGPIFGTDSLEARVAGRTPAVFTATALPPTPTIFLQLVGTSVVGVGRSAPVAVRLSSPAPVGGIVVSFASDNPSVVSVDSASMSFNQNDTLRYMTLTGVAVGTAHILADAPGYIPDTLQVTGSLNLISLPTTLNVPYGANTSIAVTLGQPAPAGGVVVTLLTSDSTTVGIVTPTVTIPQGQTSANGTVHGTALGTASVVATNPNYAPDVSVVSTTASLNITAATISAFSTFGAAYTTEFRSAGNLTPAPAGGIGVTFTPRDPTCVSAPVGSIIPAGQTSRIDSLTYGGSAVLPCVTYLVASAPGIDPDSVQVTMNIPPATTINFATVTIGSGMQDGAYGVNLATGAHGGRVLTVRTLSSGVGVVQKDGVTAGSDSISMFIPNGSTSATFYLGGLEGIVNDSLLIESSMPGFRPDTAKVYVKQGAFDLQGVPVSVNELAGNTNIYVQMGVPNVALTSMLAYQGPRAGGSMTRLATFHLDSSTIATFKDSTAIEDTVKSVTFPVGQYYTPLAGVTGLQIDPVGVGTATVTATVPGLIPLPLATRPFTVLPAVVSLNNTVVEVGAGLQDGAYGVSVSGPNHPTDTLTLKVLTTGIAYLQLNGTTVGADSLKLPIANGATSANFYISGVEGVVNDSVLVEASLPGFIYDTLKIRVRRPAVDLQGVPTTVNSLAANSNIYLQIGIPNVALTTMNAYQGPRFGGTMDRIAKFSVSDSSIATLRDSTANPDSVKTATFPIGQYYSPLSGLPGIQFDPRAPGIVTVVGSNSVALSLPSATRTSTITGPVLTFNNASVDVGSGLQDGAYGLNLGASAHGGVTVSLVIDTTHPGVAVVQPNGTTAGTDSLQIFVPNGTSSTSFFLAGLEGVVNDSVRMFATIPGFGPDTLWIRVRRPSMDLQGVPAATTLFSTNNAIYVQLGVANVANTTMLAYQGTRAGQPAESVWVKSDAPTIATVANSTVTGDSLQVAWPVGQYYTPLSVASGGLALHAIGTGSANFSAIHPVFHQLATATRNVVVSTPGITVTGGTIGSGLQRQQTFNLGASQHNGVDVVVRSTAPGIMKISPNSTTPGTDSIIVHLVNGNTGGSFYIQGVEDSVGAPGISVSAIGFTDGSAGATVVAPAIDLANVPTTISAGAANTIIYGQIGVPNGALTTMNEYQELRAGGTGPVTATFSNSNATAAQLTTTALTAQIVTALFTTTYYTPLSVATGGAAFDPLAVGSTTVTVTAPKFISLPNATRTVNVTP